MPQRLFAEFDSPEACARAVGKLERRGFSVVDAYMPYPAKSVQRALGVKASPLPWFAFVAGATGAALAYFILWYTNAYDYPINVAGHPSHAAPAFVPITFETLVLFAGCTAFFGGLALAGMPRLYDEVDQVPGFERVTVDRFVLAVRAPETDSGRDALKAVVEESGAIAVEHLSSEASFEPEASRGP